MPTIVSGTIYQDQYCTSYLSGTTFETCDRRTTIYSLSKSDVKEIGASVLLNGGAMIAIIFVVLFVLKKIFNRIFK